MTHLADRQIRDFLQMGLLVIEPLIPPIQPASIDLHLAEAISILPPLRYDPADPVEIETEERLSYKHILVPGAFVLGATQEWVEIPRVLVGIVTGKSSLARLGLQIEAAGFVDPGWKGRLTLEIKNLGPMLLTLRAGMAICQIRFEYLAGIPEHLYGDPAVGSHYQDSSGVVPARFTAQPSASRTAEPSSDPFSASSSVVTTT